MKVSLIYGPSDRELLLFKRCIWVTMGKTENPKILPSEKLLKGALKARHSPIRVLNFAFLIEGIPSNISTHLARHVHAVPFISSLRNDRQERMDGDAARRDTPVDMIYYVNAEELQVIANKRLCMKASQKTREAVMAMCALAEKALPEIGECLIPACQYHGGLCYEIEGCGKCMKA
jgi:hypothetical protein